MQIDNYKDLRSWEIAVATKLVREFKNKSRSLKHEDHEDLRQQCLLRWIEVRGSFTNYADTLPLGFMAEVVRRTLLDIVRKREAHRRRPELDTVSLEGNTSFEDADERSSESVRLDSIVASARGTNHDTFELRHDVRKIIGRLSPVQRQLCVMLAEREMTLGAIANALGISRGSVYNHFTRIRRAFASAGVDRYVCTNSNISVSDYESKE